MSLHRASTGAVVHLGQVLGRGGEGAVHVVNDTPKLVAKIYSKAPDAAKVEKLRLMTRSHSPGLLGVAAWPVDLLTDERGVVRGFLMGRISSRQDAHRLYSPKSRRRTFPDADFRFVVRAATNLARAFAQIHVAGHVIGDVNHGNALIGKDGTAVLIDCDSIQVREQGRTFTCDVGSPLFTPPELQGKAFRGLRRTDASDRFGLAVLIFHLLFQGRHPFAGVYADGEMPLERAIAESRFAYGAHAESLGMLAPPGTLSLETFGRPVARLFERAFAPPGGEEERPSAIDWIEPLQDLESRLAACEVRPRHFHPRGESCCWCDIEKRTGARLFDDGQAAVTNDDAVTAAGLWKAIEGIHPPREPELPKSVEQEVRALARKDKWGSVVTRLVESLPAFLVGGIVAMPFLGLVIGLGRSVLLLSLLVCSGIAVSIYRETAGRSRGRRALRIEWDNAIKQWRSHTSAHLFASLRSDLEKSRKKLDELAEQQRKDLEGLVRLLERRQREAFLDKFEIDKALFLEVSRAHVEKLANRGYRSAEDIRRRSGKLHDFVPAAVVAELRSWAAQCEDNFVFDTRDMSYAAAAAEVEEKYRWERQHHLGVLGRGPELLAAKLDEITKARARADDHLHRKQEYLRLRREQEKQ